MIAELRSACHGRDVRAYAIAGEGGCATQSRASRPCPYKSKT